MGINQKAVKSVQVKIQIFSISWDIDFNGGVESADLDRTSKGTSNVRMVHHQWEKSWL